MDERIFSDKYRIQEEIARGGMGVVYRALDVKLNRQIAIKLLHANLSGDPSFTERFLGEACNMARLDHENIIRIHAIEEQHGNHYIVMEYFPGANLRTLIQRSDRLSVLNTLNISLQVARALAYAHHERIIHRDIKPANVMVDARGRTKLADFGIAAALDEASFTIPGQIIGTPDYMSPEQAKGDRRTLDGRSDLYSFGVLMYEMLTGHTPYHALSKKAIPEKLLYDREDVTLQFPPDVPVSLQRIIGKLLRKDLRQRTADADTLTSQLSDALRTLPVQTTSSDSDSTVATTLCETASKTVVVDLERNKSQPLSTSDAQSASQPHSIVLDTTIYLPPEKIDAERVKSPSLNIVPWVLVATVTVGILVGATYYLSSLPEAIPPLPPERPSRNSTPQDSVPPITTASSADAAATQGQRRGEDEQTAEDRTPISTTQTAPGEAAPKQALEEQTQKTRTRDFALQAEMEAKRQKAVREAAERKRVADQERQHQVAVEREREAKRLQAEREKETKRKADEEAQNRARAAADEAKQREAEQEAERQRQAITEAQRLEEAAKNAEKKREQQLAIEKEEARKRLEAETAEQERKAEQKRKAEEDAQKLALLKRQEQHLQNLLEDFKRAYERQDMWTLESLSEMSPGRVRNLELMFSTYQTFRVSIDEVQLSDEGATAVVKLNEFINANGERVKLDAMGSTVQLKIRKAGREWGKIIW